MIFYPARPSAFTLYTETASSSTPCLPCFPRGFSRVLTRNLMEWSGRALAIQWHYELPITLHIILCTLLEGSQAPEGGIHGHYALHTSGNLDKPPPSLDGHTILGLTLTMMISTTQNADAAIMKQRTDQANYAMGTESKSVVLENVQPAAL